MVTSWYDAGARLDPVAVVPTELAPTTPATPPTEPPEPQVVSLTGTRPAYVWNPKGLTIDGLPDKLQPFKDQFVPEFINAVPSYLDGKTYQGDNGFDPWALVALADQTPDRLLSLVWAKDRKARLEAMSPDEQATALAWMREAELKHARLAMIAAAGWPISELINPLRATGGRAPSLFNGQLIENFLPIAVVFGALAYVEGTTKGTSAGVSTKVVSYGEPQVSYVSYCAAAGAFQLSLQHHRPQATSHKPQTEPPAADQSESRSHQPASHQPASHQPRSFLIPAAPTASGGRLRLRSTSGFDPVLPNAGDAARRDQARAGSYAWHHWLRCTRGPLGQPGHRADAFLLWPLNGVLKCHA